MVCTLFLNRLPLTSFKRIATITGIGKLMTILSTAIFRVFHNTLIVSGSENIYSKFSSPTQGEPKIPLLGIKSLNAIKIPLSGTYLNRKINRIPGKSIKCSCQFFFQFIVIIFFLPICYHLNILKKSAKMAAVSEYTTAMDP